jgi:uncharacterized membrane protein
MRLHSQVVQFPLALLGTSFIFDVLSFFYGAKLVAAARFNLIAGLAFGLLATLTGMLDHIRRLEPGTPAHRVGRWHAAGSLLGLAAFAISLVLRGDGFSHTPRAALLTSAFGVVVLGLSSYLGGVMVVNQREETPA